MRIKNIFLNNIWLKLLALILAFITWFYVGEATKLDSEKTVLQKLFVSSAYTAKSLSVKPKFIGNVPSGYEFIESAVKVYPESITIVGPVRVLEQKSAIETKPINLEEYTQKRVVDVELADISPVIKTQKIKVQVHIEVVKRTPDKKKVK